MLTILGYALAVVIGISLGLLGGGGSTLTVPVLVYVLHYGVKQAVAMSLFVVGLTSLFGVLTHRRAGNLNIGAALAFGPMAIAGSWLGAELALLVTALFQLTVFGSVMLLASVSMFLGRNFLARAASRPHGHRAASWVVVALIGGAVGVLTGLVGVGGGFLYVPALVLVGGLSMKESVGTSLLLITLSCAASFLNYLGEVPMDWPMMIGFTLLAFAGVAGGTTLVKRFSQEGLRRAFAVFLFIMAVFILALGRHGPSKRPPAVSAVEIAETRAIQANPF